MTTKIKRLKLESEATLVAALPRRGSLARRLHGKRARRLSILNEKVAKTFFGEDGKLIDATRRPSANEWSIRSMRLIDLAKHLDCFWVPGHGPDTLGR